MNRNPPELMKNLFLYPLALAAMALPLPRLAAAVNPALIPADARWVVYADLNTLRTSTLGKEVIALAEQAQAGSKNPIGIDLQKVMATVGTATAFGANFSTNPQALDGTLILQGTPDLRKIAESVVLQAQVAHPDAVLDSKELPFTSYVLRAPNHGAKPGAEVIVAFPPDGTVIVSKSRAQILRARDLLRGTGDSARSGGDAPLKNLLPAGRDAYLFAASVVPPGAIPGDQPQARILRMTDSGALAIGEHGPKSFAHAQLIATSGDMADKLTKILQGITAMMSLTETNNQQLAAFLNSAHVARRDRTVTLDLSYDSANLAQMVRRIATEQQKKAEGRAASAERRQDFERNVIARWEAAPSAGQGEPRTATHAIDDVALKNGTVITLLHSGRGTRFERVEFVPAGGGTTLNFRTDLMRPVNFGARGSGCVFEFPGDAGMYRLNVVYRRDPAVKGSFTVSARDPKPTADSRHDSRAGQPAPAAAASH